MERYPEDFKHYFLVYIFVLDVLVPLFSLVIMKKYGLISTLTLGEAHERKLPYVMMLLIYITTAFSLMNIKGIDGIIALAFLITATILLVVLIANHFFKISAHAASTAAGATWFFVLFKAFGYNTVFFLVAGVIMLGLVMSSRLFLKAHTAKEVYLGALVGITITLFGGMVYL